MGFFRRHDETLNERLLREAGLESSEQPFEETPPPEPLDPYAGTYPADTWAGVFARAMARPAEYDEVLSVHAPELTGDRVEFATLPEGDVIVDDEQGNADLSPLADAVEERLEPPYRVVARRREGDLWTVAARRIEVLEFDFAGGDGIELVQSEDGRELRVDGEPWAGEIPELERAAETLGDAYVVQADRLDGDLWEIQASAL